MSSFISFTGFWMLSPCPMDLTRERSEAGPNLEGSLSVDGSDSARCSDSTSTTLSVGGAFLPFRCPLHPSPLGGVEVSE